MPHDDEGKPATGNTSDLRAFAVQLRRMNSEFNRVAHDFAQSCGLHPTDMQALIAIMDAPATDGAAMTPGRLRGHLQLTSGAVTACLDRLERAGHIRRARDDEDRRVVHLAHEPDAVDVARAFFRPLAESTRAALDDLSEEQRRTVLGFLRDLNTRMTARRTEDHGA